MIACEHCHMDVVKYLYETMGNMNVSEVDHKGRTASMIACENCHIDIVKYLYGTTGRVDVNEKDLNPSVCHADVSTYLDIGGVPSSQGNYYQISI